MKLHLRVRRVAGRVMRVISLRPGTQVAFSTNRFHDTWHVVSDARGGELLAHLFWGLAFQRRAGTVVMLHGQHVVPTPFDADPSMPIVLAPRHLGAVSADVARGLRRGLGGAPDGTVRWRSHGLEAARRARRGGGWWEPERERVRRLGGCLVIEGDPDDFRRIAVDLTHLGVANDWGSDHLDLDHGGCWRPEGEIQLFAQYHRMRSVAAEARRRVLTEGAVPACGDPVQARRARIWAAANELAARRRAARRVGMHEGPGQTGR